ncbi:MAG: hypothetical protein GF317_11725 [Candidatus Lokiarchaeota archaeon]|nr:hypothetical protein [Candidatus Lokiarchaeota archaeon]MBD3200314.1 hypothetical protein [Candidatus Lokiarchaeota archaeon]
MSKILQDIWIITDSGIVLFNRVFDPTVEIQLFGALMSALNSFAEQVAEGGLSSFELKNKQFALMRKKGLLFVANASKKVKQKKINEELQNLSQRFLGEYSELLHSGEWDDDINVFSAFKESIEDVLEDPVKKFWEGF